MCYFFSLQIKNTSSLSVDYMIKFDSLSQLRYKTMQELPEFVRTDSNKPHVIGAQNYNGKCVFDCVPYAGSIPGGMALSRECSMRVIIIYLKTACMTSDSVQMCLN